MLINYTLKNNFKVNVRITHTEDITIFIHVLPKIHLSYFSVEFSVSSCNSIAVICVIIWIIFI